MESKKEEEEIEELLDFAENLDFESYMEDFEVRSALRIVRDRIAELSQHRKDRSESKVGESKMVESSEYKEGGEGDMEVPPLKLHGESMEGGKVEGDKIMKLTEKALREHEAALSNGKKAEDLNEDDLRTIATALSDVKSLRSIHSARSLKSIIGKLRERATSKAALETVAEEKEVGAAMKPPVVVRIDEEDGTRLSKKNHPSQLPYMHRNPAV